MTVNNPSVNLSIDEAMITFKGTGTSAIKQYMPKKAKKHGSKDWVRSDSTNGFICQFSIDTWKDGNITETGNVVKKLKYSTICLWLSIRPTNTGE